jgi:hypothetical protein
MDLIKTLEKEQMAKLSAGKEIPDFAPGDTLLVNVKVVEGERSRVQAYEGVCIARSGAGLNESFTVRKILELGAAAPSAAPSSITCAVCAVRPPALSSARSSARKSRPRTQPSNRIPSAAAYITGRPGPHLVIAGLDPAIHPYAKQDGCAGLARA